MIVRIWKARATPERAQDYREHLQSHVFPVMRGVPGFVSANLWERRDGEEIEFIVATHWQSLDAVRGFAGDAYELAVVAPGARAVLASFEEQVTHYEVTAGCNP